MTRSLFLLAVLGGCGRIGFDPLGDAGSDRVSFGETGTETFSGGTRDTSLDNSNPTFNLGTHEAVKIDLSPMQVALLSFDLSPLPTQTRITAAELHLHVELDPLTVDTVSSMYRVLESWEEGTLDESPGAASWNQRTPGVAWTDLGAGPAGSRDESVVVAEVAPGTADTTYVVPFNAAGVAMINEWIAAPASNFGIAMPPPDTSGWAFTSSESPADPAWRPVLVLSIAP